MSRTKYPQKLIDLGDASLAQALYYLGYNLVTRRSVRARFFQDILVEVFDNATFKYDLDLSGPRQFQSCPASAEPRGYSNSEARDFGVNPFPVSEKTVVDKGDPRIFVVPLHVDDSFAAGRLFDTSACVRSRIIPFETALPFLLEYKSYPTISRRTEISPRSS